MADVTYVGVNATDVQKSEALLPYSKVVIIVDENTSYEAGNDSGQTLEVEIPWGSQEVADNLLASMTGVQYQPYTATNGLVDPAAEIGDAVTTNSVYGGLYQQDITFGHTMYSDYSAPQDEQLDNEYTYKTTIERKVTRQGAWAKTEFTVMDGKISAEIEAREEDSTEFRTNIALTQEGLESEISNRQADSSEFRTNISANSRAISAEVTARQNDSSEFRATLSAQSDRIDAKVSQRGGTNSTFGWSLLSTGFTLYSGNKNVFSCNNSGVTIDGSITARSGYIGNGSSGFTIYNTSIRNGMTSRDDTTHNGVYVGTDGIALGKGNFKVDSSGNLTAKSGTFSGTVYLSKLAFTDPSGNAVTIDGSKLTNGTVSDGKISSVSGSKVGSGIAGGNINSGSVGTTQLNDSSVSTSKIADNAVTKPKGSSAARTSWNNGDAAKDKIDDLVAGRITATNIKSTSLTCDLLMVKRNTTMQQAVWMEKTISGETVRYLGRA